MRQRLILSLLSVIAMLVYALPQLPIREGGIAGSFALLWLAFCLMAFGGNLVGLLYRKKDKAHESDEVLQKSNVRRYRRGTGI
jgi:hypothetical protein